MSQLASTRLRLLIIIIAALACVPRPVVVVPTLAPAPSASPTLPATASAPAATLAAPTAAAEIDTLLEALEEAVLARDRAGYFAHVDQSDPVFTLEHTRWADEWARAPLLESYALSAADLRVTGESATAELTVTWRTLTGEAPVEASFPVRFTRGADGAWRYAGELWVDLQAEHFLIRAQPGLEGAAQSVRAELPAVYEHVTASLGFTPTAAMQIKLYGSVEALVANTLLSLPPIHGWNEPGEALKLYAGPDGAPESAVAHEFTHFLEFEMAGTARSRMPWWLSEGLAVYVAGDYAPSASQTAQIEMVAGWAASGELAAWETISIFESTPPELWRYVYPQGYAFVSFVTEAFGVEQRNAWVRAMSNEMDLAEATPAVLGRSFEALDQEFRAWLSQQ